MKRRLANYLLSSLAFVEATLTESELMLLLENLKLRSCLLFPVEAVCLVERFLEFFLLVWHKYDSLAYRLSAVAHGRIHRTIKR